MRVEKAARELSARTGRSPHPQELAQYLEWELPDVLDALEANGAHHAASLDAPCAGDGAPCAGDGEDDGALVDTLGGEDRRFETVDELTSIAAAMRYRNDRQREVVRLRFDKDLTQSEIADLVGVSQMQISRMLRSTLTQLRELVESDTEPDITHRPHGPNTRRAVRPSR
jgi:RNA polymerase sigma-B factor